jgi:hypothetical protein
VNPVEGGQGRSSSSVGESAAVVAWCLVATLLVVLIAGLCR